MSAYASTPAKQAGSALELNRALLAEVADVIADGNRGPYYAIGQLEEALRQADRVIAGLLEELAREAAQ